MNWVVVGQAISAILAAVGGAGIIQAIAKRRNTQVEAVSALNATTLEWAEQLKADAKEARTQAREARQDAALVLVELAQTRREVASTRRVVHRLHHEATQAAEYIGWMFELLARPDMTIERMRKLTQDYPPPPAPTDIEE